MSSLTAKSQEIDVMSLLNDPLSNQPCLTSPPPSSSSLNYPLYSSSISSSVVVLSHQLYDVLKMTREMQRDLGECKWNFEERLKGIWVEPCLVSYDNTIQEFEDQDDEEKNDDNEEEDENRIVFEKSNESFTKKRGMPLQELLEPSDEDEEERNLDDWEDSETDDPSFTISQSHHQYPSHAKKKSKMGSLPKFKNKEIQYVKPGSSSVEEKGGGVTKKRPNHPAHVVSFLKRWLDQNAKHPVPIFFD